MVEREGLIVELLALAVARFGEQTVDRAADLVLARLEEKNASGDRTSLAELLDVLSCALWIVIELHGARRDAQVSARTRRRPIC